MLRAFGLALACLGVSSSTIAQTSLTPPVVSIEACRVGLTAAGRTSSFQGTAILQADTDAAGTVVAVKDLRVPDVFPIFVEMTEFKACVTRWKFRGAGAIVVALTAGTTGETLQSWSISVGNSGQGFTLVLPRGSGSGAPAA
jgi:hypothetical protein